MVNTSGRATVADYVKTIPQIAICIMALWSFPCGALDLKAAELSTGFLLSAEMGKGLDSAPQFFGSELAEECCARAALAASPNDTGCTGAAVPESP